MTAIVAMMTPATASAESCENLALFTDPERRTIEFHDHGTEGASAGDVRIGHQALLDKDGKDVGYLRWVVTSLGHGENLSNAIFKLDDGQIHSQHLWKPTRPTDSHSSVLMEAIESVIVGGTGVYRHARGIISLAANGETVEIDIDVRCD